MKKKGAAIVLAVLAAALYAVNVPLSKVLLQKVSPTMLAGFLYLGAGAGLGILLVMKKVCSVSMEDPWLTKADLPYTIAMVVLDIAAPILLMYGIANTTSANVSLLNNFEIAATSLLACIIFREKISRKLWISIGLVTLASMILGFEGSGSFIFNRGSVFVLMACICWGVENNCTRNISDKSAEEIVLIKGIFSGLGSVLVALVIGEKIPPFTYVLLVMALGFVAYGLSIDCYIRAQKHLGAARTSAFYSIAPFLGVGFSFLILREHPALQFYLALFLMAVSTALMIADTLGCHKMYHGYTHVHAHHHGAMVHTHAHRHLVYNPMHIHNHSHKETKV